MEETTSGTEVWKDVKYVIGVLTIGGIQKQIPAYTKH